MAGLRLDVEADTALVAHQVHRWTRQFRMAPNPHRPIGVAAPVFDHDHVCTKVGQHLCAERSHDDRRRINDPNPCQR